MCGRIDSGAITGPRLPSSNPRHRRSRVKVQASALPDPSLTLDRLAADVTTLHSALSSLSDAATTAAAHPASATAASTSHDLGVLLYTLADAQAPAAQQNSGGWLAPLTNTLELVLGSLQQGLEAVHCPYSYGWSIVALTAVVKLLTFPLTRVQVESTMSVQQLKPQIDALKARYGDDKDRIQKETNLLYEKAGVNPLAGCLPTLATIPIFIALYRSLSNASTEGLLDNEGFYWIPSLSGPTTVAARAAGSSTAWLFPFVDGAPPIGWEAASRYLVLPVLLVIAQYISSAYLTPPTDPDTESDSAKTTKTIVAFLPLMIGWFSLNVPSGLSLYYFANTMFTFGQQVWLKKLGGANVSEFDLGPIDPGKARRTGVVASAADLTPPPPLLASPATTADMAVNSATAGPSSNGNVATNGANGSSNGVAVDLESNGANVIDGNGAGVNGHGAEGPAAVYAALEQRSKRKRRALLVEEVA